MNQNPPPKKGTKTLHPKNVSRPFKKKKRKNCSRLLLLFFFAKEKEKEGGKQKTQKRKQNSHAKKKLPPPQFALCSFGPSWRGTWRAWPLFLKSYTLIDCPWIFSLNFVFFPTGSPPVSGWPSHGLPQQCLGWGVWASRIVPAQGRVVVLSPPRRGK